MKHVEPPPSKRKLIEDKVDDTVEELKERHDDRYSDCCTHLTAIQWNKSDHQCRSHYDKLASIPSSRTRNYEHGRGSWCPSTVPTTIFS